MGNTSGQCEVVSINIPLPRKIHQRAKGKASVAGKTLKEWVTQIIADASK